MKRKRKSCDDDDDFLLSPCFEVSTLLLFFYFCLVVVSSHGENDTKENENKRGCDDQYKLVLCNPSSTTYVMGLKTNVYIQYVAKQNFV